MRTLSVASIASALANATVLDNTKKTQLFTMALATILSSCRIDLISLRKLIPNGKLQIIF